MARTLVLAMLGAAAIGISGCSDSDSGGDDDDDDCEGSGCGSAPTVAEDCETIMGVLCGRLFDECLSSPADVDPCVADGVPYCCTTRCDEPSPATRSEVETCTNDLRAASCDGLANEVPASCVGVLAP
ncbi:MAG TPA: hypothetical protein VF103_14475 [Polyangiaceae bacterium]